MSARAHRLNSFSLWLGWSAALGVSIVANFQELAVFKVHLAGAIMAFGVGSLYMWTQVGFMVAYQKRVYIYEM